MTTTRAAIITGASSGIGRALALHLTTRGIGVLLVGRDAERLRNVREDIMAHGGNAHHLVADVGQEAHAARIVEACLNAFQRIDLLVNNAGVGHYQPFLEMTPDVYMRVSQTNWCAVLHVTSKVLPVMKAQGQGAIVNISSVGAMTGVPYRSIYGATKAAIRNWSRSLYLELRPFGIHVLCVVPGSTATRFFENMLGQPPMVHAMPGRVMSPDKVAQLIWRGLETRQREVILSPMGRLVDLANRFSPSWIDAVADLQHRRTAKVESTTSQAHGAQQ